MHNYLCFLLLFLTYFLSAETVFVGSHSKDGIKGLFCSELDADSNLKPSTLVLSEWGTTVLVARKDSSLIYSCGIAGKGKNGLIQAYDTKTDKLVDTISAGDLRPCYLALCKDQKFLFVSNIKNGSVCSIKLNRDGSFAKFISKIVVKPMGKRFAPHACVLSPEGDYLFVPDIAGNRVCRLSIDQASGELKYLDSVTSDNFTGPRHMTFDQEGRRAYLVNQMGEAITVFNYVQRQLQEVGNVQTLPDDQVEINNHIAEIKIHPSGKFVYASNRGHNSIALLKRDIKTGMLRFDRSFSSGGQAPWSFAISAKGKFLYCSNNKSNNLVTFKIDQESGALSSMENQISVANPASVIILD